MCSPAEGVGERGSLRGRYMDGERSSIFGGAHASQPPRACGWSVGTVDVGGNRYHRETTEGWSK